MFQNHNIPQNFMDELFTEMDKFFNLPLAEKEALKLNDIFRGYFGFQQEITNNIADWKEGFDIGYELNSEHPDVKAKKPLHGPNQWPPSSLLPGWREKFELYSNQMLLLGIERLLLSLMFGGQTLMQAIALSLGKHPKFFLESYGTEPIVFMRLLKYFPSSEKKLGVGTHTDYGCITILSQVHI